MLDLFNIYEQFIGTVNTHQGGHVKPNRNFTQWVNTISIDIFKDMCEEYQRSQVMSDELTIFLKTVNVIVPRVTGQMWDTIVKPKDYEYFASAKVFRRSGDTDTSVGCSAFPVIDGRDGKPGDCKDALSAEEMESASAGADDSLKEYAIKKIPTDRWAAACNHVNLAPTINNAKCTQYDKGFKLAPKSLGIILLDYFRAPLPGTFDYTLLNPGAEDEYIQYNAGTSNPLEWKDTMLPEFLARLQKKYGRFVREQVIEQAGKDDSKI